MKINEYRRMRELEEKAKNDFLKNSDFCVENHLDSDEERVEYKELFAEFLDSLSEGIK